MSYLQAYKNIDTKSGSPLLENFNNCNIDFQRQMQKQNQPQGEFFNSCTTREDKFNNIMMPYNIDNKLNALIILSIIIILLLFGCGVCLFKMKKK